MSDTGSGYVLVHAPYGRDAAMIAQVLHRAGICVRIRESVEALCAALDDGVGAALVSDHELTREKVELLAAALRQQPAWSDLPLIVTTSGGEATAASRRRLELLEPLGNVALLERPLRSATLISAVLAALRARHRQYQLRDSYIEREGLIRELKRSNYELAQFAHVVSHDLQAPIRTIRIVSQILESDYRDSVDAKAMKLISTIQDCSETMDKLTGSLLNYAVVGHDRPPATEVDLQHVTDAVLATLQPAIEESGAEVSSRGLPAVQGDPVLLRQLLQNLLSNALKFRRPGVRPAIWLSSELVRERWLISVGDNGPGIPTDAHEGIFLPLRRLHGREVPGTGMGLAVCRKIVERHGGEMWVESETGEGATFRFTLPLPSAEPEVRAPEG
jgi:signal transduction histidine kinase